MQTTVTLNQAIHVIKQLSLADQWRLLEWLMGQFKEMFLSVTPPESLAKTVAEFKENNDLDALLAHDNIHHKIDTEHYFTIQQVSQRLVISESMTQQWINRGLIPAIKWHDTWLIPATAFDKFMPIEQTLNDLDAEKEVPSVAEIEEIVGRGIG
jgi:excisionase family DNA binding protein